MDAPNNFSRKLSTYEAKLTTNNGAVCYHSKIKSIIEISHPRICSFLATLNEIIDATDNVIGRLRLVKKYVLLDESKKSSRKIYYVEYTLLPNIKK